MRELGQSVIARDSALDIAISYSSTPILQSLTKMDDSKLAKVTTGPSCCFDMELNDALPLLICSSLTLLGAVGVWDLLGHHEVLGDFPAGPMPNQYKFIHQVLRLSAREGGITRRGLLSASEADAQ